MLNFFGKKNVSNHEEKIRFTHEGAFSVLAPENWKQDLSENHFSIAPTDGSASFTGGAYRKNDGGINQFAEVRFSTVQDFYSIVDEKCSTHGKLTIITREYEGIWPDESELTYYAVICVESTNLFISFSIVSSPEVFNSNRELYESIVHSTEDA